MNHEKHEKNEKIVYKEESYKIQGGIFEVYRETGSGFLEAVYQECLETEFAKHGIPFEAQVNIHLKYKEKLLQQYYRADIVCYGKIILEIQSVKDLNDIHRAQMLNYLRATQMKLGLLVNFGSYPKVTVERIVA